MSEIEYCWYCKGFGYHQYGDLSSHNGYKQCLICNSKQLRPKEDYEVERRREICGDLSKIPTPLQKFRRKPIPKILP